MDNSDLIVVLGIGLTAAGLAFLLPPTFGATPRPVWLPVLLGVIAAVCGVLAFVTVAVR